MGQRRLQISASLRSCPMSGCAAPSSQNSSVGILAQPLICLLRNSQLFTYQDPRFDKGRDALSHDEQPFPFSDEPSEQALAVALKKHTTQGAIFQSPP